MLTKDQAAKIISRHAERGIDSAFLLMVDILTDPESPEFDESEKSRTLERVTASTQGEPKAAPRRYTVADVMFMCEGELVNACRRWVLGLFALTIPEPLDWNFAMRCRDAAVHRVGSGAAAFMHCLKRTAGRPPDYAATATPVDFARAALLAVSGRGGRE